MSISYSEAPDVQIVRNALNGELFGVPVGPVEGVTCLQQAASMFACEVRFGANSGPSYAEPFSTRLYLTHAGGAWLVSE